MLDLVLFDFDGDFQENDSDDKNDELNKCQRIVLLFETRGNLEASNFRDVELGINDWAISFDKVAKIIICKFGDGHTEEKDGGCFKEEEEHGDFLSELD